VLSAYGDGHPDLALYADKLAAAHRARGALREAMRLHARSLELRSAAFGPDDRSVATSLLYRARTALEAGELGGASMDAARAMEIRTKIYGAASPRLGEVHELLGDIALARGARDIALEHYTEAAARDPRLDLAAVRAAAGARIELDAIAPQRPDEALSIERTEALATRVELLVAAGAADEAKRLASELRARYRTNLDPAFAAAIGRALAAAGDAGGAAHVLAAAAAKLGNEPTLAALRIFVTLARTSDTRAAAAARAAISLYQAMPKVDRTDHDEMWAISRRPQQ
jgi:tetratricopeptide (TPR) repeat protein